MEGKRTNQSDPRLPKGARIGIGVIMVIIYLAVGLLFILNIFDIWNRAVSCSVGGLLILYGIWRGYRLYKGMN